MDARDMKCWIIGDAKKKAGRAIAKRSGRGWGLEAGEN